MKLCVAKDRQFGFFGKMEGWYLYAEESNRGFVVGSRCISDGDKCIALEVDAKDLVSKLKMLGVINDDNRRASVRVIEEGGKNMAKETEQCACCGNSLPTETVGSICEKTCKLIIHDGSPTCSECLAEQSYDAKFCDQCGAKVTDREEDNLPELKRCPFCGGMAVVARGTYETRPCWVFCRPGGHSDGRRYDSEREAIEAWNERYDEHAKSVDQFSE